MSSILVTCRNKSAVERHYLPALAGGGWRGDVHLATPGQPLPPLEGFAGLLMTGGDDIHPRHWDEQEALDNRAEPDEERDALELPAVRRAWALGLPILGICRGEQLLNVALGGSLYQDLPRQLRLESALHRRGTSQVPELAHTVTLAPESRLAALTGLLEVAVNSRHHQAVLGVAPLLKAAAWHQGLVEGVEAVAPERWVVGVQWHPENLVGLEGPAGEAARAIFRGFNAALATR